MFDQGRTADRAALEQYAYSSQLEPKSGAEDNREQCAPAHRQTGVVRQREEGPLYQWYPHSFNRPRDNGVGQEAECDGSIQG